MSHKLVNISNDEIEVRLIRTSKDGTMPTIDPDDFGYGLTNLDAESEEGIVVVSGIRLARPPKLSAAGAKSFLRNLNLNGMFSAKMEVGGYQNFNFPFMEMTELLHELMDTGFIEVKETGEHNYDFVLVPAPLPMKATNVSLYLTPQEGATVNTENTSGSPILVNQETNEISFCLGEDPLATAVGTDSFVGSFDFVGVSRPNDYLDLSVQVDNGEVMRFDTIQGLKDYLIEEGFSVRVNFIQT